MLRRLLSRKGIGETERESMLASVEERGSAYLPQVNAFYVREFKMMHAAEDATRFLHQACQGLPQRLNGHTPETLGDDLSLRRNKADEFYTRVVEHAVGYFGSRVLYPSRPAPETDNVPGLSRAALEKAVQSATRGEQEKFESLAQEWGYRMGSQIYDAYLAGKVAASGGRTGAGAQGLRCRDIQTAPRAERYID
jgi:hypothetical protein